ncbi:DUF2332 domain-containing protein [Haloarchaeobius sp. TZWWS8]|uniref:DUF2332 domain-containing protein n=1 Tax=Haloarchaeobius sp. TZWWS8 TaxID=3446121 RepID=UPI003EBA27FA
MTDPAAFTDFARWCDGTSPLYARLARGVAADDDLLAIAGAVPADQPGPNNLFAAVHALLLDGVDHPVRRFYPSVVDDPVSPEDVDPVPAFREFVVANEERIREFVSTRRTQTNAVGRCAALYPAFAHVAERVGEPFALVEVGCSAGLNLLFDRYRYRYETAAGERRVGHEHSSVSVETVLRGGDPTLPPTPPTVAERAGIDVNPLDVTDEADVNWLRALVWPEHTDRLERLTAACELARRDPPRLVAGDALDVLPEVVAALPDGLPVVGFDTQVRYQFTEAERERFDEVLSAVAAGRALHWLSGDATVEDDGDPGMTLTWTDFGGDGRKRETTTLARYEGHGRWLRWLQ